jgi:hypothetical protein
MTQLIYIAFTLSGAAGLLYGSVWSRYLGLFVGHGAYAQILVLVIFLGGMSLAPGTPAAQHAPARAARLVRRRGVRGRCHRHRVPRRVRRRDQRGLRPRLSRSCPAARR